VVEYRIAVVYEAIVARDQALRWLDKAIDDRGGVFERLLWLKHDPAWTSMRNDPRFKSIQRRAGW